MYMTIIFSNIFFSKTAWPINAKLYIVPPWTMSNLGVSCRISYPFVVYLYVNRSGSITSVGEERANLSVVVYLLLYGFF